jgi:cyclohexanecarboxylate-CoA ligase
VRLREGASLSLADITTYLEAQRMARQYMPERLEILPELPRTPSGKIQKFKLRDIARAFGQA